MGRIGVQELLLIFGIVLLIFGPSKLPKLAKSMGKGVREFKQASKEITDSVTLEDDPEEDKKGK